jgi:hypothetical protein
MFLSGKAIATTIVVISFSFPFKQQKLKPSRQNEVELSLPEQVSYSDIDQQYKTQQHLSKELLQVGCGQQCVFKTSSSTFFSSSKHKKLAISEC